MELKAALAQAQAITQAQTALFFTENLPRLVEVDPWLGKVGERLQQYCLRPGKALRPLLLAAGAALSKEIPLEKALCEPPVQQLMLAIELVHKRLLMADDVADRDERRNDAPAFHTGWEQDLAVDPKYASRSFGLRQHVARSYTEIAGILLQRLSDEAWHVGNYSPSEREKIDRLLLEFVYEKTSAGWYLLFDQNFEALDDQTSEEIFLQGLELVTGGYSFQAPLLLGAALGGQYDSLEKELTDFGAAAGVLFQLTDDVIGLFGDPDVTGKPVGGDIREGKKTLLVQYAYRLGDERQRQQLRKLVGQSDLAASEVEVVREIVKQTGAFDQTQAKIADYVRFGEAALGHLPEGEVRNLLAQLLHYIAHRQA